MLKKWKQLQRFLKEIKLRFKSMNYPWFYDKVSNDWLNKLLTKGD